MVAPRQPAPPPCSRCSWPLTEVDDDGDTFCHRCGHIDYALPALPLVYDSALPSGDPHVGSLVKGLKGLGYSYKEISEIVADKSPKTIARLLRERNHE